MRMPARWAVSTASLTSGAAPKSSAVTINRLKRRPSPRGGRTRRGPHRNCRRAIERVASRSPTPTGRGSACPGPAAATTGAPAGTRAAHAKMQHDPGERGDGQQRDRRQRKAGKQASGGGHGHAEGHDRETVAHRPHDADGAQPAQLMMSRARSSSRSSTQVSTTTSESTVRKPKARVNSPSR